MFKKFGRLVLAAALASLMGVNVSFAEEATINFRDVEINSAIESMSALTGKTFIVDPRVRGKISILSTEAINSDAVYDIFLSALMVQGYQAINDGNAVRIIPAAKAANVSNTPGSGEFITEVIVVDSAKGDEYLAVLKPLVGPGAMISYHKASNALILSDTEAQIARFKSLLANLEKSSRKDFEVIDLEVGSASDLVAIASQTGLLDERTTILGDKSTNRIIVSGPYETRFKIKQLIKKLDVPKQESKNQSGVDVIFLEHADAIEVQPVLESLLQSMAFKEVVSDTGEDSKRQNYTVQADKANNALIVAASSQVTSVIRGIVEKLDKPRSQVLIEAVIAEVSEDFFKDLSVNLASVGTSGVFLTDFGGTLSSIAGAMVSGSATDQASAVTNLQGTAVLGATNMNASGRGLTGLVQAIRTDTKNTLLSTPSILTLDNEEATISIGQEVPFVTGSYTTGTNGATNPFQTVERKEVGTILKVRPQISAGGVVRLAIEQEVSNINLDLGNSTTDKKVIQTNVAVGQNQTLVLGGLIDRKFSTKETKVPLLGDVPLFGALFRGKQKIQSSTVLMVFIRPSILLDDSKIGTLTDSKYQVLYGKYKDFVLRNDLGNDLKPLPSTLNNEESFKALLK